jgi:hypothetical protein
MEWATLAAAVHNICHNTGPRFYLCEDPNCGTHCGYGSQLGKDDLKAYALCLLILFVAPTPKRIEQVYWAGCLCNSIFRGWLAYVDLLLTVCNVRLYSTLFPNSSFHQLTLNTEHTEHTEHAEHAEHTSTEHLGAFYDD